MTDEGAMESRPAALPAVPTAPDLLAPVHAFRDWRVTPEGLTSPRTGVVWTSRIMKAECRPRTPEELVQAPHRPPGQDCSCGIRAYFRPSYETSRVDYTGVTGIVTVWGAMAVHADGVRAEFARVEALSVYARWTRRQKAAVAGVAEDLGVDVVDVDELQQCAHRYASPVPESLVPARPHERRARRRARGVAPRLVIVEG
jgi:hypothetical protein